MRRQLVAPTSRSPLTMTFGPFAAAISLALTRLRAPDMCCARSLSLPHTHTHTLCSHSLPLWLAVALSRLHAVMSAACCCFFNFGFIRFSVLSLLFVSPPTPLSSIDCFGCFAYSSISLCVWESVCARVCVEYYEPFIKMFGFLFLSFFFIFLSSLLRWLLATPTSLIIRPAPPLLLLLLLLLPLLWHFVFIYLYCFLLASYRFSPYKIQKNLRFPLRKSL